MNLYLSKRKPPIKLNDIVDDFKNGPEQMAKLLEILCGCRIDTESGRNGFAILEFGVEGITFIICQIMISRYQGYVFLFDLSHRRLNAVVK